ncbi:hypothetical protein LZ554_007302 [Drepanopeziza brunnea f. sp. 'monogermtubi']|nr:hypothetical protein LZ554_007302 [Drepanopeziza brunnea f. sp. 'monogermtubi']
MTASGNKPGDSNAYQVQIPIIVFFAVTPIFVAIRIWSRISMRAGLKWDDWSIIISFIFSMTVSTLIMISCYYGFGQRIQNLSPENRKVTLQTFWIAQGFYKLTINLTKASILLLYLRIFVQRPFRIICYTMLVIIVSYMVATWFATIFQCTPIPRAWDRSVRGTCIDITKNWYANAGFSVATDVIILVLPMPPLYQSQLPPNQKRALMFVFALGAFVVVTSILRMRTLESSTKTPDTTYNILSSLWTMIEPNVAIICACLPMCRLPLTLLFPSIFPSKCPSASSCSHSSGPRTSRRGVYGHAGTAKNEWAPTRSGAGSDTRGINLTSVQSPRMRGRSGDDASDESIFSKEADGGGGGAEATGTGTGIHKVTDYTVTYEDGDVDVDVDADVDADGAGRVQVEREVMKV